MLTTREGGAAASTRNHTEDVGVNDLGDGGAAMRALRRSQPWEAEASDPAGACLVLEEDRTEETRQTVKAARVLNNLN